MGLRPVDVDKFKGCLLGAAIGDALGAPYEFKKAASFTIYDGYQPGIFPGHIAGTGTDDSDLLGFHCDSIPEAMQATDHTGALAVHYTRRLIEWYKTNPLDMGTQTRLACEAHLNNRPVPDGGSCGNGSLMAVAPAGLMGRSPLGAAQLGKKFSLLTHPNELCIFVCAQFSAAIYELARNTVPGQVLRTYRIPTPAYYSIDGNSQGYAPITAGLAFNALTLVSMGTLRPYDAMKWVINFGGDTDTNACVTGALLGAAYGIKAWEEEPWLIDQLGEAKAWIDRAEELHTLHTK